MRNALMLLMMTGLNAAPAFAGLAPEGALREVRGMVDDEAVETARAVDQAKSLLITEARGRITRGKYLEGYHSDYLGQMEYGIVAPGPDSRGYSVVCDVFVNVRRESFRKTLDHVLESVVSDYQIVARSNTRCEVR